MNMINFSLGERGSDFINDTSEHQGTWCAVQIIEDAEFTQLDDPSMTINGTLTGQSFPAGLVIGGAFVTVELASGAVIMYNAEDDNG